MNAPLTRARLDRTVPQCPFVRSFIRSAQPAAKEVGSLGLIKNSQLTPIPSSYGPSSDSEPTGPAFSVSLSRLVYTSTVVAAAVEAMNCR